MLIAVAGRAQDRGRGPIDFPAAQVPAARAPPAARGQSPASRAARMAANACANRSGTCAPGVAHPGDVSKHRAGAIQLAPQVEQHHFVRPNRAVRRRRRQVVRVAGVFRRRDVRVGIADEPLVAKPAGHELLDVVFGRRRRRPAGAGRRLERAILHPVELIGRLAMCRDRSRVPDRGEPLDEIAGRHDVDARLADQLDVPASTRAT